MSLRKDRQSVFFTALNPMYSNQDLEEVQYDLDKPRIRCAKFWRVHRNTVFWCSMKQVVFMKTGEDLYCKVHQFPRLPRVVLTPNSKCGRQNPPYPEARKSTDHHSEQSANYRETCRGNVDYRKKTRIARKPSKILIQQFEKHPNRDWLIQDLNRNQEFNQFSEKSKELSPAWATLELCEISSKIQCPDRSSQWDSGTVYCTANACSLQKGIDSSNKARYDSLSIPGYHLCGRPCST